MVYLSLQELEYFDCDPFGQIPKQDDLHRMICEVMEAVRLETGFDPYRGGQVVVEASAAPGGMSLAISKVSLDRRRKPTREEFRRAKGVRVVNTLPGGMSRDALFELMEELGITTAIKEKPERRKRETFVFKDFSALEEALTLLPDEELKRCALYRGENGYALLTRSARESRVGCVLSEYADSSSSNTVFRNGIKEAWKPIAERDALVTMAGELRKML